MRKEKILITGASGFIGRHLIKKLNDDGYSVVGTSRSEDSKFIRKVDIEDFTAFSSFVIRNKIKRIIHLAASSVVEEGQRNPLPTYKTNIIGTLNVLEIARLYNLSRVIVASTAHVYGKNKVPYKEIYTPHPTRPYETSKACVDLIAQSYVKSFGLDIIIPRFVNIYGPGDLNFSRLIPRTIKTILDGESPLMWGGESKRDYLYIGDAVNAYITLLNAPKNVIKKNTVFNFGTEKTISVKSLINKIIAVTESSKKIKKVKDQRSEEIVEQYLSIYRAKNVLHWKPTVSLDEGLKITVNWYKNNRK